MLLGVGASRLIGVFATFEAVVSAESIALAFGVSAAVGIFFFCPPQRASALDPIEALRSE